MSSTRRRLRLKRKRSSKRVFVIPNSASIHGINAFMNGHTPFKGRAKTAILQLHAKWTHAEPIAMVMAAAWGARCRREGLAIEVENLGPRARYLARMKLFDHLGVDFEPGIVEHEEAGRFIPITQVTSKAQVPAVIADISALLHLDGDPESLSAVQYCVSELLRNVLEHSNSPDGAFVAAHRFTNKEPHRVTIAVADCGQGIRQHLGAVHAAARRSDHDALVLAMQPGITGARPGPYGTADNAGAGLFITRCIAKGTGGYFLLLSGKAGYRLRRSRADEEMTQLHFDGFEEPRHDQYEFGEPWPGSAVSIEVRTEKIGDYDGFFEWIFDQIPRRAAEAQRRIRFT